MTRPDRAELQVVPVDATDPQVRTLLAQLTAELAAGGYTAEQTFGYSPQQLEQSGVHLVGGRVDERLVAVAGIELQADAAAELKRFFVEPERRGTGVADALIASLLAYAEAAQVRVVRLETGDKQLAAQAFYRRHGFRRVPRFGRYVASETSVCMQRDL